MEGREGGREGGRKGGRRKGGRRKETRKRIWYWKHYIITISLFHYTHPNIHTPYQDHILALHYTAPHHTTRILTRHRSYSIYNSVRQSVLNKTEIEYYTWKKYLYHSYFDELAREFYHNLEILRIKKAEKYVNLTRSNIRIIYKLLWETKRYIKRIHK